MNSYSFILFGIPSGFEVFEYSENSFKRMIGVQVEPIISPIHKDTLLGHLHNENGVSYLKIYTRAKGMNNFRPGGLIGVGLMSSQGILRFSDKNISILVEILDKFRKLVSINEEIKVSTFKEIDPTKLSIDFKFIPDLISIPSNITIKDNPSVLIAKDFPDITKRHHLLDKLCCNKHFFVLNSIDVLNSELNNSNISRFRDAIYMFSNSGNEVIPFKEVKFKENKDPRENDTKSSTNPSKEIPNNIPSKLDSQDLLNSLQYQVQLLTRQLDEEKRKYERIRVKSRKQRNLLLCLLGIVTVIFFYSQSLMKRPKIPSGPKLPIDSTKSTSTNPKDSALSVNFDSLIKTKDSDDLRSLLNWYKVASDTSVDSRDSAIINKRKIELSKKVKFMNKAHELGIDTAKLNKRIPN